MVRMFVGDHPPYDLPTHAADPSGEGTLTIVDAPKRPWLTLDGKPIGTAFGGVGRPLIEGVGGINLG